MLMIRDITRYLIFEFPNEGVDSCDILTNVVKSIEEIVPRTSVSQGKSNFFHRIFQLIFIRSLQRVRQGVREVSFL